MKCEWALGTCNMYCYNTLSINMSSWLLQAQGSEEYGQEKSSQIKSHKKVLYHFL